MPVCGVPKDFLCFELNIIGQITMQPQNKKTNKKHHNRSCLKHAGVWRLTQWLRFGFRHIHSRLIEYGLAPRLMSKSCGVQNDLNHQLTFLMSCRMTNHAGTMTTCWIIQSNTTATITLTTGDGWHPKWTLGSSFSWLCVQSQFFR